MGFRTGSYATVWETKQISDVNTKARISISRKDKRTGEYTDDFTGYVVFLGTANAANALRLKRKDRIKLGDVDVSNRYDKEKKTEYTDYKVFSFELADGPSGETAHQESAVDAVDSGEVDSTDYPF